MHADPLTIAKISEVKRQIVRALLGNFVTRLLGSTDLTLELYNQPRMNAVDGLMLRELMRGR